jgi:hypothetical protein
MIELKWDFVVTSSYTLLPLESFNVFRSLLKWRIFICFQKTLKSEINILSNHKYSSHKLHTILDNNYSRAWKRKVIVTNQGQELKYITELFFSYNSFFWKNLLPKNLKYFCRLSCTKLMLKANFMIVLKDMKNGLKFFIFSLLSPQYIFQIVIYIKKP